MFLGSAGHAKGCSKSGLSPVAYNHLLASTVAEALRDLVEEYEDRKAQFGGDYLWEKHEDTDTLPTAQNALKRWDEANTDMSGEL